MAIVKSTKQPHAPSTPKYTDPIAALVKDDADARALVVATQAEVAGAHEAAAFAADDRNFTGPDERANLTRQLAAVRAARERLEEAVVAANRAASRKAKTAEALEAGRKAAAVEQAADNRAALDATEKVLDAMADSRLAHDEPGLAFFAETLAKSQASDEELREHGLAPAIGPPGSFAAAAPRLIDRRPGAIGRAATLLNYIVWREDRERREREARLAAEERQARAAAEHERSALAGHLGEEERTAAQSRQRQAMANFYAHGAVETGFMAGAPPELEMLQQNARLAGRRGE